MCVLQGYDLREIDAYCTALTDVYPSRHKIHQICETILHCAYVYFWAGTLYRIAQLALAQHSTSGHR